MNLEEGSILSVLVLEIYTKIETENKELYKTAEWNNKRSRKW